MGFILLLIMISVPIAEIAVFIQAGDLIGLWPTLGVIILTAIIGTAFIRIQGLGVIRRVQESLNRGDMPVSEMFDGVCLLVAGALLLTPGFITDGIGFALLVAPLRRLIASQIARRLTLSGRVRTSGRPDWDSGVIDGEFEDVTGGRNDHRGSRDKDEKLKIPERRD